MVFLVSCSTQCTLYLPSGPIFYHFTTSTPSPHTPFKASQFQLIVIFVLSWVTKISLLCFTWFMDEPFDFWDSRGGGKIFEGPRLFFAAAYFSAALCLSKHNKYRWFSWWAAALNPLSICLQGQSFIALLPRHLLLLIHLSTPVNSNWLSQQKLKQNWTYHIPSNHLPFRGNLSLQIQENRGSWSLNKENDLYTLWPSEVYFCLAKS